MRPSGKVSTNPAALHQCFVATKWVTQQTQIVATQQSSQAVQSCPKDTYSKRLPSRLRGSSRGLHNLAAKGVTKPSPGITTSHPLLKNYAFPLFERHSHAQADRKLPVSPCPAPHASRQPWTLQWATRMPAAKLHSALPARQDLWSKG